MWRELDTIKKTYSPELNLLLDVVRSHLSSGVCDGTVTLDRTIDWPGFVALVRHHRLIPIVYPCLCQYGHSDLPEEVRLLLKALFEQNRQHMLDLSVHLIRLARSFEAHGIACIPLKGPTLAQKLYGDPTRRQSKDLDLLIADADLPNADALLQHHGFKRTKPDFSLSEQRAKAYQRFTHHFVYRHTRSGPTIELHWRILGRDYLFPMSTADLLCGCDPLNLAGTTLLQLRDEDLLPFLAAHGSHHLWFRLFWLVDVAQLIKGADHTRLEALFSGLNRRGLHRPLAEGFLLANLLFQVSLPPAVEAALQEERIVSDLARMVMQVLGEIKGEGILQTDISYSVRKIHSLRLCPTSVTRMRNVFGKLAPQPCDLALCSLPDGLFPLYYLMRPFLWWWRVLQGKVSSGRETVRPVARGSL